MQHVIGLGYGREGQGARSDRDGAENILFRKEKDVMVVRRRGTSSKCMRSDLPASPDGTGNPMARYVMPSRSVRTYGEQT